MSTGRHVLGERTISCGHQVGLSTACQTGIGSRQDAILRPSGWFEFCVSERYKKGSAACQADIERRKDAILWPSGRFEHWLSGTYRQE